jgi:dTDP-4-amino-4,6-dideoxygalactose transaminase
MNVPFLDLKAQYLSIRDEIDDAIRQVINSCSFAGGPFVEKFEKAFAEFCDCPYAIGVASGTDALWLSLLALGVGTNDEVITVPNTFIATAEAISFCGATPVFVDIDKDTFNMDVTALESAITPRTRAIIPVHLYGQMADMQPIMDLAKKYNLHVIEDACQAHGAKYYGKKAGSIGAAGCFSFYPGKNLGAYGDAGAVVTQREDLAHQIRRLRDHGQAAKYQHQTIGWNARMDGIQGAILNVKLRHLSSWNDARRRHAAYYTRRLKGLEGIRCPVEAPYASHVYHVYAILTQARDEMIARLEKAGVQCGIHYPVPVHRQPAYRTLNLPQGEFPRAESNAKMQLSLPMFPELSEKQLSHVVESVAACIPTHQRSRMAVPAPVMAAI